MSEDMADKKTIKTWIGQIDHDEKTCYQEAKKQQDVNKNVAIRL